MSHGKDRPLVRWFRDGYPHTYSGAVTMCGVTVSAPEFMARGVLTPLVAFDTLTPSVLPDLAAPGSPLFITEDVLAKALQAHPKEAALLEKRLQETSGTLPTLSLYYMGFANSSGVRAACLWTTARWSIAGSATMPLSTARYTAMPAHPQPWPMPGATSP